MDIYTIGHSNVEPGDVVELLRSHGIEAVLDVRSSPYSKHAPQFNREAFAEDLLYVVGAAEECVPLPP